MGPRALATYFWPALLAFIVVFFSGWMYGLFVIGHLFSGQGLLLTLTAEDWQFVYSYGAFLLYGWTALSACWGVLALHQSSNIGRRVVHAAFCCVYVWCSWRVWRTLAAVDPDDAAFFMTLVCLFFLPVLLAALDAGFTGAADHFRRQERARAPYLPIHPGSSDETSQ